MSRPFNRFIVTHLWNIPHFNLIAKKNTLSMCSHRIFCFGTFFPNLIFFSQGVPHLLSNITNHTTTIVSLGNSGVDHVTVVVANPFEDATMQVSGIDTSGGQCGSYSFDDLHCHTNSIIYGYTLHIVGSQIKHIQFSCRKFQCFMIIDK